MQFLVILTSFVSYFETCVWLYLCHFFATSSSSRIAISNASRRAAPERSRGASAHALMQSPSRRTREHCGAVYQLVSERRALGGSAE